MDIVTYALCKKLIESAVSGITDIKVVNNSLIITLKDGSQLTMDFPIPEDGVSIENVSIDTDGSLLCTLSNGEVIDAGTVPSVKGDPGYTPVKGVDYFTEEDVEEITTSIKNDFDLEII